MLQLRFIAFALGDFATGMQNRGVIAATKMRTDFGQTFLRQFFGQKHGNLPWLGDFFRAFGRIHVSDLDFVEISHGFLDRLYADMPRIFRQ